MGARTFAQVRTASQFSGVWIVASLVLTTATGAAAAVAPHVLIAGLVMPAVIALVLQGPEFLLILFLTAGVYKGNPWLEKAVPVDLTVLFATLLAVALLVRFLRRPLHVPAPSLLLAPMLVMLGLGIFRPASEYGAEKALRFCTLTCIGILSSIAFLDRRPALHRFLVGLALLGIVTSLSALSSREVVGWGRLTTNGANPISLARVGALAFAFGWLRFNFSRGMFDKLVSAGMAGLTAVCVLASGSRGPAISTVIGMVLVSAVCAVKHRKSPLGVMPLAVLGGLGVLMVSVVSLPFLAMHRFELLVSENQGASVLVRGVLFALAWKQMLLHPLGLGVGGFERVSFLDLSYPHNLLLEVGCELGWIPLIALLLLITRSLHRLVRILLHEYSWGTLFLAMVVLTTLGNSMVSGDLNDNRLLFSVLLLPFIHQPLPVEERAHDHRLVSRLPSRVLPSGSS